MRDTLFARLEEAGVRARPPTYDLAAAYVDEQLGYEIARAFFGSDSCSAGRRRSDRQLQAALRIMRGARTQDDALTIADDGASSAGRPCR